MRLICLATLVFVGALLVANQLIVNDSVQRFRLFLSRIKGHEVNGGMVKSDTVAQTYTLYSKPIIERLKRVQTILLAISLCLLATIAVFIFEPMVRTMSRQMEALESARALAIDRSESKSAFLANMSHEIRTPMNGVLGMLELTLQTKLTDRQREYLSVCKESASSLLSLLNDILDVSKIEAGRLDLESVEFDIRQPLRLALVAFREQANEKGISLGLKAAKDVPPNLKGDPNRLRQVLVNLIGNAVKFTSKGGVKVRVALNPNLPPADDHVELEFTVADTGAGINADKLDTIFDAFTQEDVSTTRRFGGTGLGLSICKQLVQMMGGDISVESKAGQGSTFRFTARFERGTQVAELTGGRMKSAEPQRALVVDDSVVNQRVAAGLLRIQGHRPVVVRNGLEAVEAWKTQQFDLILMDLFMPEMDGLDATRVIRGLEADGEHIPIIGLTASVMAEDRDQCVAAGMDGFLAKPVDPDELCVMIETLTHGREIQGNGVGNQASNTGRIEPTTAAKWNPIETAGHLEGNHELIDEFLVIARQEIDEKHQSLAAALAEDDASQSHLHAHSLKGAANAISATRLAEVAWEAERTARDGDLAACRSALPRIEAALLDLDRKIAEYRRELTLTDDH